METILSSLLCISLLIWSDTPEAEATRHKTANLEASCLRHGMEELNKKIDEERGERLKLAEEFKQYVKFNSRCNDLSAELQSEREKSVSLQNEVKQLNTSLTDLTEELQTERNMSVDLQNEVNQLNISVTDLTAELQTEINKSVDLQNEVKQLSTSVTDLTAKLQAGRIKSVKLQIEVNQLNISLTDLTAELQAERKKSVRLQNEVNQLNTSGKYPENCDEIYKSGTRKSGVYNLYIKDGLNEIHQVQQAVYQIPVYCDMDTTTGGWTVFQRRQDGSVRFDKTWEEYKQGFGELQSEFWLGNKWLAMITASNTKYTLRVDLESFDKEKRYAKYKDFKINYESDKYRLNIGSYSGDAGDGGMGLSYHNQIKFSTKDQDNDELSSGHCAVQEGGGGFWYNSCEYANLNGLYKHAAIVNGDGINWHSWLDQVTLKHTEMKLKPIQ